ncbi:MAG: MotA/TolQ/ExbB proton channel family protein [Endomicrobium sp.]|jgi:biopolymer transport protein ExbB|nr:MotA/TolQ/ExbB proton channel family protein [Endomicrobium sp.]
MFEGKSFVDIINMGGYAVYILLCTSFFSITIICFKLIEFYTKSKVSKTKFLDKLIKKINAEKMDDAIDFCDNINSPISMVAKASIIALNKNKNDSHESTLIDREIMLQTAKLERFVAILGTIGSTAVYIGLFGTVVGIIKAFHDISKIDLANGMSAIIEGVSEALIATAAGLFVAIPAVVAYNLFMKLIDRFIIDMEYCSLTIKDIIKKSENKKLL